MGIKIHIENARLSFANGLFTKSAAVEGAALKYGADFIVDAATKVYLVDPQGKKTPTTLAAAEKLVAADAWKAAGEKMLASLEASKRSVRSGDLKLNKAGEQVPGYAGNQYVTAKSEAQPRLLHRDKTPLTRDDGVLYSGCRVYAIVELYANTAPGKKGVFAGLKGVQFMADDEAFGGGAPASADEFEQLAPADAGDFGA